MLDHNSINFECCFPKLIKMVVEISINKNIIQYSSFTISCVSRWSYFNTSFIVRQPSFRVRLGYTRIISRYNQNELSIIEKRRKNSCVMQLVIYKFQSTLTTYFYFKTVLLQFQVLWISNSSYREINSLILLWINCLLVFNFMF